MSYEMEMTLSTLLRALFAFVVALTATDVSAWAQGVPPDAAAIGVLGEELFRQSGATGMVLVVVRGDGALVRGYGETAPGSGRAPDERSMVRLCSLTKIFTADVLAKLAADGTVRLDAPLAQFAPRGARVPEHGRAITLEDLATHTAGLPREVGGAPAGTPHFTFPDYGTRWRWLRGERLRSTPGTAALYSNVGFDLLGDALATAARTPYPALLAGRTLNPLGMGETTFFPNAGQCGRLLKGAHDEGPCTVTEATEGSSGLYSDAVDMRAWLQYLLREEEPGFRAQEVRLTPAALRSQQGLDRAGEPTGVGLGWIHLLPADSPSHLVEKTGGGAGFETYIALNHARRTAIFVAATDGTVETHVNVFNAANKLLLAAAGLPPLPAAGPVVRRATVHRRRRR